jgi:hypothetical protein
VNGGDVLAVAARWQSRERAHGEQLAFSCTGLSRAAVEGHAHALAPVRSGSAPWVRDAAEVDAMV